MPIAMNVSTYDVDAFVSLKKKLARLNRSPVPAAEFPRSDLSFLLLLVKSERCCIGSRIKLKQYNIIAPNIWTNRADELMTPVVNFEHHFLMLVVVVV